MSLGSQTRGFHKKHRKKAAGRAKTASGQRCQKRKTETCFLSLLHSPEIAAVSKPRMWDSQIRWKVIQAHFEGQAWKGETGVAKRFVVSPSSCTRWWARFLLTGSPWPLAAELTIQLGKRITIAHVLVGLQVRRGASFEFECALRLGHVLRY